MVERKPGVASNDICSTARISIEVILIVSDGIGVRQPQIQEFAGDVVNSEPYFIVLLSDGRFHKSERRFIFLII